VNEEEVEEEDEVVVEEERLFIANAVRRSCAIY